MSDLLLQLPGFLRLNTAQQAVILKTLKIQSDSQAGNLEAIEAVKRWYCHASALAVECGSFDDRILTHIPEGYQACEGTALFNCSKASRLNDFLNGFEAPFVLHMIVQSDSNYLVHHSLIALGQFQDTYYVWEKRAAGKPFMLSTTDELVSTFPKFVWGKRHFVYHSISDFIS